MRILRYNLEVPDNYTISSNIGLGDDSNLSNPGIIVTAMDGYSIEDIIPQFHYSGDPTTPEFQEDWKRCLHGEKTSWKLASAGVCSESLVLNFVNEEQHHLWKKLSSQGIHGDELRKVPASEQWLVARRKRGTRMHLRFCVEIPGHTDFSVTEVQMRQESVCVTEFGSNGRRVLEFVGLEDTSRMGRGSIFVNQVYVTEFTW